MTEGETSLNAIQGQIDKIRKFGFPLVICFSVVAYIASSSITFSLVVFCLLSLTAIDEYRVRRKILDSEELMNRLKKINKKRKASVFVNGGVIRDLKHMLIIAIAIGSWMYLR